MLMLMSTYWGITISVSQSVGAYPNSGMCMVMVMPVGATRQPAGAHAWARICASSTAPSPRSVPPACRLVT